MEQAGGSDRELLERSAQGEHRAFSVLFERHSAAVTRYAWALMVDRADVQEIVQDTFVTAWKKAQQVTIVDASLLPWLLVTCRNHALNLRRKRSRTAHEALDEELADVRRGEDERTARERLRWVMEEIAKLDDIDRRICQMCLIDGLSYKDAAAAIGSTSGAVGKRLERARTRIRKAVMDLDS